MKRLTRVLAIGYLVGLILLAGNGLISKESIPPPKRDESKSIGDMKLQLETIERIRHGEPYYAVVGDELRRNHYPTLPVINWRTPLHYCAVALLTVEQAGRLMYALGLGTVVFGALVYLRYSAWYAIGAGLALLTGIAPAVLLIPDTVGFPEHWAGLLIGVSLVAYAARQWVLAAIVGVLAVFVRELVAPYGLICGVLAFRARRRTESMVWIAGGLLYCVYYGVHASAALAAVRPDDLVRAESYFRWPDVHFVFKTLFTHGALTPLPATATPLAAAFGLGAVWSRHAPVQLRISVLAYFVLFSVVGQPFNFYWGYMTGLMWSLAFLHAPEGLSRMVRLAAARTPVHSQPRSEPQLAVRDAGDGE